MAKTCKECDKQVEGRQVYCSDRCRKAYARKSDKEPGQAQLGQLSRTAKSDMSEAESLLESWRRGKGTEYQRRMGDLAAFYSLYTGCATLGQYKAMVSDTAREAMDRQRGVA